MNIIIYIKEIIKSRFKLFKFFKEVKTLKNSEWFDKDYYSNHCADVETVGINPYFHYIFFGKYESRVASENHYLDFDPNDKYKYRLRKPINLKRQITNFKKKPLISIILYVDMKATGNDILDTLKSINKQWYKNYEILVGVSGNKQVGLNEGIENVQVIKDCKGFEKLYKASKGDYIASVKCGDELTQDALFEIVKAMNTCDDDLILIYADDDKIDKNANYIDPHFKTDFNYEMILSYNYVGSFAIISKSVLRRIDKPFDKDMHNAQIYDTYLKVIEITDKIEHIQKVLYHKKTNDFVLDKPKSIDIYIDEKFKNAVQNHLERINQKAKVENGVISGSNRVCYDILDNPLVSIVIPFKDKPKVLKTCITSIVEKSTYENFEIILLSNNSSEKDTFDTVEKLQQLDSRIKFYEYNVPFNYSKINNYAVKEFAKGEYILFLNNDTEILSCDWIETMLGFAKQENVGAVGAKLLYSNNTVQSAGIGVSPDYEIIEYHKFFKNEHEGYFARLAITQNMGAVTAACLMVSKQKFLMAECFDESNFPICYNDIDLCFKLIKNGYVNVFSPDVKLYHYESLSRGKVVDRASSIEYQSLKRIHGDWIKNGDKFYNKNFNPKSENFELR